MVLVKYKIGQHAKKKKKKKLCPKEENIFYPENRFFFLKIFIKFF